MKKEIEKAIYDNYTFAKAEEILLFFNENRIFDALEDANSLKAIGHLKEMESELEDAESSLSDVEDIIYGLKRDIKRIIKEKRGVNAK